MKIVDLYCGLGGWARGLIDTGHDVTGYDIVDFSKEYPGKFVHCNLLNKCEFPANVDVIVASPPCTDFSKASFPLSWKAVVNNPPDIPFAKRLFNRAYEIIEELKPKYFIIENVRGAQAYVGKAKEHFGSRYLWGKYPALTVNGNDLYGKYNLFPSSDRASLRAVIPYSISKALGEALNRE